MLNRFHDYSYSRAKRSGNKPGAFYFDKSGTEWLIKFRSSLSSVEEAFYGNLYRLFVNETYVPTVRLIEGKNPDTGNQEYMVSYKIHPGYTPFTDIHLSYDEKMNKPNLHGKKIDGLELVTLVSALLKERDFFGNGNIGVDLKSSATSEFIPAFRIDFDDTLQSEKDFSQCHFMGDILQKLNADSLIQWHLFDRAKACDAMIKIGDVKDENIDKLFSEFKPFFEEALRQRKKELEDELASIKLKQQNDPDGFYYPQYTEQQITDLEKYFEKLTQKLETIKKDKAILLKNVNHSLSSPTTTSKLFEEKKPISTTISTFKQIETFFTIYDGFYTAFQPDFAKQQTKKLLKEIEANGNNADAYLTYQKMMQQLMDYFSTHRNSLTIQQDYLKYLDEKLSHLEDYTARRMATLESIAFLKAKNDHNESLIKQIKDADNTLNEILSTQTKSEKFFHNSGNYAVIREISLHDDAIVFKVNTHFPGITEDKQGCRNDMTLWQQRIAECDKLMLMNQADVIIKKHSEDDETICYVIHDFSIAKKILEQLNESMLKIEPYPDIHYFKEVMNQLEKPAISLASVL